jgi:hypothetical protein
MIFSCGWASARPVTGIRNRAFTAALIEDVVSRAGTNETVTVTDDRLHAELAEPRAECAGKTVGFKPIDRPADSATVPAPDKAPDKERIFTLGRRPKKSSLRPLRVARRPLREVGRTVSRRRVDHWVIIGIIGTQDERAIPEKILP